MVNGRTIEMGTVVVVGVLCVEHRRFKMGGSRVPVHFQFPNGGTGIGCTQHYTQHTCTQVTLRAACTHEEIRSTVCSISLDIFRDPEIQLDPAVDLYNLINYQG